jgi:hypothetical protein
VLRRLRYRITHGYWPSHRLYVYGSAAHRRRPIHFIRSFKRWLPLWWRNQIVRYRGCRPDLSGDGWVNKWTLCRGWAWRYVGIRKLEQVDPPSPKTVKERYLEAAQFWRYMHEKFGAETSLGHAEKFERLAELEHAR